MRLLLDTQAVLWWLLDAQRFPDNLDRVIEDTGTDAFVSSVSAWEIAIKTNLGKLPEATDVVPRFEAAIEECGFIPLSVTTQHALAAGGLPIHHKDPFDRLLIGQALVENLPIVTTDNAFQAYDVQVIW